MKYNACFISIFYLCQYSKYIAKNIDLILQASKAKLAHQIHITRLSDSNTSSEAHARSPQITTPIPA